MKAITILFLFVPFTLVAQIDSSEIKRKRSVIELVLKKMNTTEEVFIVVDKRFIYLVNKNTREEFVNEFLKVDILSSAKVLSDHKAASMYGSIASNGAILITTEKNSYPNYNLNSKTTWNNRRGWSIQH